jgi:hypothetical protein
MKSNPRDLQPLLDEVLTAPGEHVGPNRADLVEMVRHENSRRRRLRGVVSFAGAVTAVALALAWPHSRQTKLSKVETPLPRADIVINHVDDQQLLALLKDTPVALMEWPNGERTLLIVESSRH